jgi:hypothetical protein
MIADRLQHARCDQLAFAAHDALEGAARVIEQLWPDERPAVAAGEHEAVRPEPTGLARKVEDFGDIGKIVEREADGPRLEAPQLREVVARREDLEIQQAHFVVGRPERGCHPLEAKRLQPEVDLGVHEGPGVDEKDSHDCSSAAFLLPILRSWARDRRSLGPSDARRP